MCPENSQSEFQKKRNKPLKTKFIAEVSSNHNQNLDRSLQFIRTAKEIGFDAVKFQLFRVEELFSIEALSAHPNLLERKQWELPEEFIPILAEESKKLGIEFSCTPFYLDAVSILEPYVDFYKIASYELLWHDLAIACAKTGKPLVISTGMATMDEVDKSVRLLQSEFPRIDLSILHAVSSYPAPTEQCNLSVISTLRNTFNLPTGWSDHTVSDAVINAAVLSEKASLVELHIDLDGSGAEFISGHCWLPEQAKLMISNIREGLTAIGDGIKNPVEAEISDRDWRADPSDGLRPLKAKRNHIN
jgi:N-acetylneuraminate synthase